MSLLCILCEWVLATNDAFFLSLHTYFDVCYFMALFNFLFTCECNPCFHWIITHHLPFLLIMSSLDTCFCVFKYHTDTLK